MKKQLGFTLIEVIMFIIVTSILATTLLLAFNTSLLKTPTILQDATAVNSAKKCIEWFIGQRRLNGYSALSCPSTSVPSFCTVPSGYSIAVNVSCTTINSDSNYKTITVTVGGLGDAKLSTLVANY